MTSIASSSLMLPVAEMKRDPAPNRAGASVAGSAFKAALATASNGGAADKRQRPAPETAEDKPTGKEATQPVLTLLALAKAASQSNQPPAAEPVEADAVDAADAAAEEMPEVPTAEEIPEVPAAGKPDVGVVHAIAATAHAGPGAVLPIAPALAKATDRVAAKDPKPPSRPAATPEVALGGDADPLDPLADTPSQATTAAAVPAAAAAILLPAVTGSVAAGKPTLTERKASTEAKSTPARDATFGAGSAQASANMLAAAPGSVAGRAQTSAAVNGAADSKAATPISSTVEIGGSSAGQVAAPVSPTDTPSAAPAQMSQRSLSQDIAEGQANTPPGGPGPATATAKPEIQAEIQPRIQPKIQPAIDSAASSSAPASPRQALAALSPVTTASPAVGSGSAATALEPQTGAAGPATPAIAPATPPAIVVVPAQAAAPPLPAGPAKPADEAASIVAPSVSATAGTERAASEPASTVAQTAAVQTAEAASAPATKAATVADPGKAAAVAPVSAAASIDASGSDGPSQDGAAGQGRGDERSRTPAIPHEGIATKTVVAPAPVAAPNLAPAGAPGPATSQVLQLFSSLGLTSAAAADTRPEGSASDAQIAQTAASAAVRPSSVPETMTLQLAPESLGRITVTLRLRGQSLDVRLVADKRTTLESLGRDRQQLEAALGVTSDAIDIAFGPQTGSPATEGAPQRSAAQQNNPASDQGHGRSQGRSQDAGTSGGEGDGTGTAAPRRPAERSDGSLYL